MLENISQQVGTHLPGVLTALAVLIIGWIINTAFMALLSGLGVATAIAFGWGGRDAAKRFLDRHVK